MQITKFTGYQVSTMLRPRIICKDGFSMSVQGNEMAYSIPRKFVTEYQAMEVGYPSEVEDIILEHIELEGTNPIESVYPYVPIEVIEAVIQKHGGIDFEKTFQ